jgi:hypothetical protein
MDAEYGWSGPAYLVNNAGPASASDLPFDVGLRAGARSVDTVTSAWQADGRSGQISVVNVASVAGDLKGIAPAWCSASKAVVAGYTRYLAASARISARRRLRRASSRHSSRATSVIGSAHGASATVC